MPFRLLLSLFVVPALFADSLSDRYLPGIEDAALLEELSAVAAQPTERTWRTADEIRALRVQSGSDLPLSGLRLALDPGHLGGEWADYEGRNFRIADDDYWVREGELVLEVAQRVRDQLVALGAEVLLLREDSTPLNSKLPADYLEEVIREMGPLQEGSLVAMADYAIEARRRAVRRSIVIGEIATRARIVNEQLQPDALLSLHINAARWPVEDGVEQLRLVGSNHLHMLIFGCVSASELARPGQREQLERKLNNGSGPEELRLAQALARSLVEATSLPAAKYDGNNAIRPEEGEPYVWARNLMLLRLVECPVVLLEPYVANSKESYPRLQAALQHREQGEALPDDDILIEYADAVSAAVLRVYGGAESP